MGGGEVAYIRGLAGKDLAVKHPVRVGVLIGISGFLVFQGIREIRKIRSRRRIAELREKLEIDNEVYISNLKDYLNRALYKDRRVREEILRKALSGKPIFIADIEGEIVDEAP